MFSVKFRCKILYSQHLSWEIYSSIIRFLFLYTLMVKFSKLENVCICIQFVATSFLRKVRKNARACLTIKRRAGHIKNWTTRPLIQVSPTTTAARRNNKINHLLNKGPRKNSELNKLPILARWFHAGDRRMIF